MHSSIYVIMIFSLAIWRFTPGPVEKLPNIYLSNFITPGASILLTLDDLGQWYDITFGVSLCVCIVCGVCMCEYM